MVDGQRKKLRLLIVCRWPVGGIRTYLNYNYRYFDTEEFDITLLANREIECEYVERDMNALGVKVVWAERVLRKNVLPMHVAKLLFTGGFDLIHSQGFTSGFYVAMVDKLFRVPHVLTIHGILEKEYFEGRFEKLKRFLFRHALRSVTVFHSVSQDMLTHVREQIPSLKDCAAEWVVINNGIDPSPFLNTSPEAGPRLKEKFGLGQETFVFGFFGRLIHQKGFNFVIDAVKQMSAQTAPTRRFVVLVLSQGDFIREYRADVTREGLEDRFLFEHTEPGIHEIIAGCDAVLMPSIWEAWGLLANEALCAGVPLIASTCIGLREAIADTPAVTIPPRDSKALAEAMVSVMTDPAIKERHIQFQAEAAERFDVEPSARKLIDLFRQTAKGGRVS